MMKRIAFLATFLATAAPAQAQRCEKEEQVGWIGINGFQCSNCRMDSETMVFSTEPRITAVAPGSPASGVLRAGDVIVSVNGVLITTTEGGNRLVNMKPGQNLAMVVRRDGELVTARLGTLPGRCPGDFGNVSPAIAGTVPRGASVSGARPSTAPTMIYSPRAVSAPWSSQMPRASFGFGIICPGFDCSIHPPRPDISADDAVIWDFKASPEVYSVETNSPAWQAGLRRGDVLTHIDGVSLTSDEGGRRFGGVKPGQIVQFTYRRGGEVRNASMRSEAQRRVGTQDAEESIRRARELANELSRQEREQYAQYALLVNSLRELQETDSKASREAVARLSQEQAEQARKFTELQSALARAQNSVRAEGRVPLTTPRPTPSTASLASAYASITANTIRYSGKIGNADVEVRGGNSVSVNESDDEIVITVGNAVIRIKKR